MGSGLVFCRLPHRRVLADRMHGCWALPLWGIAAAVADMRKQTLMSPLRTSRPKKMAQRPPRTRYWITSSAVADSVSGMVRPRALAVFRFSNVSYLKAIASTGIMDPRPSTPSRRPTGAKASS
jgi:hypothetical protein